MPYKSDTDHFDVIIVGAGLAGLSAGYNLKKADKNLRILIVEAKDRVGGRTQTVKLKCSKEDATKEWDVGGQWVTDTQKHVTSLLKELNIPTYKQYDTGISVLEAAGSVNRYKGTIPNTNVFSLIDLQLMMMKINRECNKTNTLDPFVTLEHAEKLNRTNVGEYYYTKSFTKTARGIFDVAIRAIYGLEPSQVNALFATMYMKSSGGSIEAISFTEKDCAQEKRVEGGTQQISKRLLELILEDPNTAKILYEAPLIEVNQEQKNKCFVKVLNLKEDKEQIFSCKKLISAIPINQYLAIKFVPDLPFYKKNFFSFVKAGNYIKTTVTYKKAFWRDMGYSGMVVSDGSVFDDSSNELPRLSPVSATWDATTNDGEPALIVFSCGSAALLWQDQSYEVRKREIISSLVRYFGAEAATYIDYYEKNWNSEPYNGGCPNINVVASGSMDDYARATREPYLNLHLCGTESAVEWQGYMDGAIESGLRAANEVAYCLNLKHDYSKTYYHQKEETNRLKKLDRKKKRRSLASYMLIFSSIVVLTSGIYHHKDTIISYFK